MNIEKINNLVINFRNRIEVLKKDNYFSEQPFINFPNGCCGDTCDLMAQYLLDNQISSRYICGTYMYDSFENIYSHAWLELEDDFIVDITADQFKNNPIFKKYNLFPCYVGDKYDFYELFEIEKSQCRNFYVLNNLGDFTYARLNPIYEKINQFIF